MGTTGIAALILAAALLIWGIILFNRLVARRNHALAAWSDIDVQLKRRHDLLPKLVEAVKAYRDYEKSALEQITRLRGMAGPADLARRENEVSRFLRGVFALVEAYPDLKANRLFLDLQNEISRVEEQIQFARRYYNGAVRELNILVESFPGNLVAGTFRFGLMDYFEIELATQRESPDLRLS